MYGGYGAGMGSMYGGGLSSMCGGYGGYGAGMSSMYGGGMPSMYGGAMNSAYGSIGGGMSSMYGGGLSSMSGGYGGLGMNGMLSNPANGTLGVNGMGGALALPGELAGGGLLPSQSDQQQPLQLPKQAEAETRQERKARRRQEKEAVERHRQQKRQLAIHSTIEIVGHVLQILFQLMRSGLELFGVGFGTYYSIKALKSIVKSQEGAATRGLSRRVVPATTAELKPRGPNILSPGGKWRSWVLAITLFVLMEIVYRLQLRYRQGASRLLVRRRNSDVIQSEEDGKLDDELSNSEECSSEEEWSEETTEPMVQPSSSHGMRHDSGGRVYVAMYDYECPEGGDFIGFKAGDRFFVEDYVDNNWCQAITANGDRTLGRRGLVPGNFLQLLKRETKL